MNASPVFVYGTLMAGGRLEHMLPTVERIPAVVHGFALYGYARGAYPVMMPAKGHRVKGELVLLDANVEAHVLAWDEVLGMELGAGYTVWQVTTRPLVMRNLLRSRIPALAFVFTDPDDDHIGQLVDGGDWRAR